MSDGDELRSLVEGIVGPLATEGPTRRYRTALAVERRRVPLLGDLPETPWDPLLTAAMREGGVAVHKEEVRLSSSSTEAMEA